MSAERREALLAQLALEARELADLDVRRLEHVRRIEALRLELEEPLRPTSVVGEPDQRTLPLPAAPVPTSPDEKVKLFRHLFRGRPDVFPTRFVSRTTGKAGYAPACANKFVRGVCGLPTVRCGECTSQAFLPVDDAAILGHLRGHHVMGSYPMLADESCWFLAADFDEGDWKADVAAFRSTCLDLGFPAAVERSRSGAGAHAWFFFAAPVPARLARDLGSFLLTETMSRRHELAMRSYDRLFPSQDTLPRGGFGNLIALPLQHEARQRGNTVFVDEHLEPIADQWAYLADLTRLDPTVVQSIAGDAALRGRVLGVRRVEADDDQDPEPWTRPPSGRVPRPEITGPLPRQARAVLAQRLFVEKAGLPAGVLSEVKRLAAFQNPEFYKRQSMRLSTALTPRVIACAEDLPQHVALPRGCLPLVEGLLRDLEIEFVCADERHGGEAVRFGFEGELTPLQQRAARTLLAHETGVFVAPPGVGKTVLGTYLVAQRGRSTLVLVHRQPLLEQWIAQLSMFLGVPERQIGRVGGGKSTANGRLDVAMIQSLVRKGAVRDEVAGYGHVIVDECHHVPAVSFERVLSEVKARFIVGLTATPQRRDGRHPIIEMQIGPVRFAVDARSQAAKLPFAYELVVRETAFRLPAGGGCPTIQEIYGALARDSRRNELVTNDILRAVHDGRSPIVLTERRDHLDILADRLRSFVRHLVILRGGMTPAERRLASETLAAIPDDEERLVLATGRYVGEGFDDSRLDTLFLAAPIAWKGTLTQYAGRLHRLHPRKTRVLLFDYVDSGVELLASMFRKRLRTYRAIGYARGEAPLAYGEPVEGPRVEFDAESCEGEPPTCE